MLTKQPLGYRVLEARGPLNPTYSLHCSSLFWFNQLYIKDPNGLTNCILRILKFSPEKELQWRL